ncbi:putative oxidoreductase [Thozetella sp. PMI_491]|nr:putative oxidoreductase [Thozetella sp. PMI_491]
MAPIRVGIIGLSSRTGLYQAGTWCGTAHIPYLLSSPAFRIVAVTGRSTESAQKAITTHKLPETTKIYRSAEEIAADPDVDLVVITISVDSHFANALAVLRAGKDIFLEWPFGSSTAEAEELTQLATAKGIKTMVGLETRPDPILQKVKEIIADGTAGKIICSTMSVSSSLGPSTTCLEGSLRYMDMSSGGNEYRIYFGHMIDTFTNTLGDFDSVQAVLKTQFSDVTVYNTKGEVVNPAYKKTTPDHVLVQGILTNGAVGSVVMRKPQEAADGLGVYWLITGTEGEIEVTVPEGPPMCTAPPGRKLRVKIGKNEAREIDFQDTENIVNLEWNHNAHNVARLYDAFANGDTTRYATFESALKTRRLMDEIVKKANFKY